MAEATDFYWMMSFPVVLEWPPACLHGLRVPACRVNSEILSGSQTKVGTAHTFIWSEPRTEQWSSGVSGFVGAGVRPSRSAVVQHWCKTD